MWLFERKYHLSPVEGKQRIFATRAEAKVARVMGIRVGSPVLFTELITYLDDGYAIELHESYLRGDTYSYEVTFYRRKVGPLGSRSSVQLRDNDLNSSTNPDTVEASSR